jgi:methionine biosynthesis protein MetW
VRYLERVYWATFADVQRGILDAIEPRPGGALLDLGCAAGSLTTALADRMQATRICGVEIDPSRAATAAAKGVEVVQRDLCQQLPWDDETFDLIHSNQVIEHLSCTDHFMAEIRRLLRPDGAAVICTNNLASWHNVAALVVGAQPPPCHVSDEALMGAAVDTWDGAQVDAHAHLRIFTGRALDALALHHGLRTDLATAIGYYPLPPRLARPLARLDRRHGAFLLHRLRVA